MQLSHEHHYGLVMGRRIQQYVEKLKDKEPVAPFVQTVIRFFDADLLPHFAVEEEILFPVMEEHLGSLAIVAELLAEHQVMRMKIARFRNLGADTRLYDLLEFSRLLVEHIRKEERILFDMFEDRIPANVAQDVSRRIEELESKM